MNSPDRYHERARTRGVNPIVYWLARALLQPFAHLYFRLSRIGREHIPTEGPVIFVSNHRSFADPFILGLCCRRPVYYVAKQELFGYNKLLAWLISNLGAFPVRRGEADAGLRRDRQGDPRARRPAADLPRGHAHAPGRARQAQARRRPARARDRRDRRPRGDDRHREHPPRLQDPPREGARADRRPAEVPAGGRRDLAARRRRHRPHLAERDAAVGVAGRDAAAAPRRRGRRPADLRHARQGGHRGRSQPGADHRRTTTTWSSSPSPPTSSRTRSKHYDIGEKTNVLVLTHGLVPPLGTLPSGYVAEHTKARAVGILGELDGGRTVVASADKAFARLLGSALVAAGVQDRPDRATSSASSSRRSRTRPRPRRPTSRRPPRSSRRSRPTRCATAQSPRPSNAPPACNPATPR